VVAPLPEALLESTLGLNDADEESVGVTEPEFVAEDVGGVGVWVGDPLVPLVQPASAIARTTAPSLATELTTISPVFASSRPTALRPTVGRLITDRSYLGDRGVSVGAAFPG
jgi:hypothetical protein